MFNLLSKKEKGYEDQIINYTFKENGGKTPGKGVGKGEELRLIQLKW